MASRRRALGERGSRPSASPRGLTLGGAKATLKCSFPPFTTLRCGWFAHAAAPPPAAVHPTGAAGGSPCPYGSGPAPDRRPARGRRDPLGAHLRDGRPGAVPPGRRDAADGGHASGRGDEGHGRGVRRRPRRVPRRLCRPDRRGRCRRPRLRDRAGARHRPPHPGGGLRPARPAARRGPGGHPVHRRRERRVAGGDTGPAPRADPAQRGTARAGRGRRPPRSGKRRAARTGPPCARLDRAVRPGRHGRRLRRPPPHRLGPRRGRPSRAGRRRGRSVLGDRHRPRQLTVRLRPDGTRPGQPGARAGGRRGSARPARAHHRGRRRRAPLTDHRPAHRSRSGRRGARGGPGPTAPRRPSGRGRPAPRLSLWTVVHAERRRDTRESAASLAAALGTPLVAPGSGSGPATAPEAHPGTGPTAAAAPGTGPEAKAAAVTAPALRALVPADQEITAHPGWTLGVSEPVPVAELPAADRHAASALRRARAGRAALVRHRAPGPHSITSLVAPTEAQQHAQALLAPLAGSPPSSPPSTTGSPCTEVGTAPRPPSASTATPSASASPVSPASSTPIWTTPTSVWSCGSPCVRSTGARHRPDGRPHLTGRRPCGRWCRPDPAAARPRTALPARGVDAPPGGRPTGSVPRRGRRSSLRPTAAAPR